MKSKYVYNFLKIAIVGFILVIALSIYAKIKIEDRFREIADLSCQKVDVNILRRTIQLEDFNYRITDETGETSYIKSKQLKLSRVNILPLLFRKILKINSLTVNSSQAKLVHGFQKFSKIKNNAGSDFPLSAIYVDNIYLNQVKIDYDKRKDWNLKLEDLNLHFQQFKYIPSQKIDASSFEGISFSFSKASWIPELRDYALFANKTNGNFIDKTLAITDFDIRPLSSKENWHKKHQYQKARLHLSNSDIVCKEIDFKKLLGGKGLNITELTIKNSNLNVFIDQKLNPCPSCYKPFLSQQLTAAKVPIDIPLVRIQNSKIDIDVSSKKAEQMAAVNFEKINATIYNITNLPEKINTNGFIKVDVEAMLQGKEKLSCEMQLALNDPQFSYQVKSEMDAFELTKMNGIFQFGTKAKIESGQLIQLNFEINGNNELATGDMNFMYDNLQVEFLGEEKIKPKVLLNKIINVLVVQEKNTGKNFKTGKMYYPRKMNRDIFHNWWKTIQTGFKSSILPEILLPKELKKKKDKKRKNDKS